MSHSPPQHLAAVDHAIGEIRAGRMVILVDDEDRENEGDLVMAADLVTPEIINFMARFGRGLICVALTEERVAQLSLAMMSVDNRSPRSTAFTVSVDAAHGITTGISARERADTIRVTVAPEARPEDLVTPGHVFPLRARRGGVLVRSGHTEGSVDLARMAGRAPAAVICEIMRDDGEMARMPDLVPFAEAHGLPLLKIADLIEYRLSRELLVRKVSEANVRPRVGGVSKEFRAVVYATDVEDTEYLALVLGEPRPEQPTLVRVQTASVLRDVFATTPDPASIGIALRAIEDAGAGVLLYVAPRGRASLVGDFAAHAGATPSSGPGGSGPVVARGPGAGRPPIAPSAAAIDRLRDFGLGAQVLTDLGCGKIRLMTNNPRRVVGASGYGLDIVECVPFRSSAKVVPLREQEG